MKCQHNLAFPILRITVFVWSEPIYVVLSLIFVLYLPRFLMERHPHQFIILVILAALGSMQRYAGIGIIAFGMVAIVLFLNEKSFIKRFLVGSAFGVSAIPYILWLLYIPTVTTRTMRSPTDPISALLADIGKTPAVISQWFFPTGIQGVLTSGIVTVVLLLLILLPLLNYFRSRRKEETPIDLYSTPVLVATYVAVYMVFYYAAQFLIYTTGADHRHLSVILIYVMVLLFYVVERLSERLKSRRWAYLAFINVILIAMIYPAIQMGDEIKARQFWCCDGTRQYRYLPIIEWLNAHPAPGHYYSNTPIPLYYTYLPVFSATRGPTDFEAWSEFALARNEDIYLVWIYDVAKYYHQGSGSFYFDIDIESSLSTMATVEVVAEFPEGKIYRLHQPT